MSPLKLIMKLLKRVKCKINCCYQSSCSLEPAVEPVVI